MLSSRNRMEIAPMTRILRPRISAVLLVDSRSIRSFAPIAARIATNMVVMRLNLPGSRIMFRYGIAW